MICYACRRGGPWSARHEVRGAVAAPERAAATLGGGGRGPIARPRRDTGRGPGGRDDGDHGALWGGRAGGGRGGVAGRSGPGTGRRPEAGGADPAGWGGSAAEQGRAGRAG